MYSISNIYNRYSWNENQEKLGADILEHNMRQMEKENFRTKNSLRNPPGIFRRGASGKSLEIVWNNIEAMIDNRN